MYDWRRIAWCLTVGLTASMLPGCEESQQIRSYQVPHSGADQGKGASNAPRMLLGAIVPHGGQSWFFKAVGPPDVVEPEQEHFLQFVRSLQFPGGTQVAPTWTLPEGWEQQAGSGMRYATLRFGSDESAAELTVIALPTPEDAGDGYVLSNVNRWREQLQLPHVDGEQLASEAEIISLGETEATVVQMRGVGTGGMSAGEAGGMLQAAGTPHPDTSPHPDITSSLSTFSRAENSALKVTAPEGWSEGEVRGMRKAAFTVVDGEQAVEITVIDLVAEAGELLPNVNRWREQIQLGETTAAELAAETQKICVGGAVGDYVELVGPEDATRPQTILAAVVLRDGKSWFVKLMGDSQLAAQEEERFKSFVRSVQF